MQFEQSLFLLTVNNLCNIFSYQCHEDNISYYLKLTYVVFISDLQSGILEFCNPFFFRNDMIIGQVLSFI